MTAAQPNTPNWQAAPTTATLAHGNRLAVVSLVLALVPLVAGILSVVVPILVAQSCSVGTACQVSEPLVAAAFTFTLVMYALIVLSSISAVVTGGIALGRAGRYPPRQARRGVAIAGLVVGIMELVGGIGVIGFSILIFAAG